MLSRRYSGVTIPYANSSGSTIASGAVVVLIVGLHGLIGIACDDIATGTTGALAVEEVHELAALSTDTGSIGDTFYWDSANSRLTSTPTGNDRAGMLVAPKSGTDTTATIKLFETGAPSGLRYSDVAASTAVTNTVTETLFDKSFSIPANTLKVGDVIRVRAEAIATATNSTDTLNLKAYIGGLAGTAIVATGAVDVANNDIGVFSFDLTVRTIGASGTIVGTGSVSLGASGTATAKAFNLASTAIDTTAAQVIGVSATWSVANAGNSCRLDILDVEIIR